MSTTPSTSQNTMCSAIQKSLALQQTHTLEGIFRENSLKGGEGSSCSVPCAMTLLLLTDLSLDASLPAYDPVFSSPQQQGSRRWWYWGQRRWLRPSEEAKHVGRAMPSCDEEFSPELLRLSPGPVSPPAVDWFCNVHHMKTDG